ncbi:GAF domain-containing protein [Micromonospora carbonacea]|jgi:GAF domain-containing protein|uniref:GAF domain-containing protein n=1 Tax=Micromonospora carbonacea TaxID=47853 RepID=UPI00331888A5
MADRSATDPFVAAISGALADPGPDDRALLISVVGLAQAIFGAAASSVFLRSEDGRMLVFEAAVGQGSADLIGRSFPADQGIAGWVAATGEPVIVDDSPTNGSFAADFARSTGYTPNVIMAVPVTYRDDVLGVLEVLDPAPHVRADLSDLSLLTMFAAQAGLALRHLVRHRAAQTALRQHGADYAHLAEIVGTLRDAEPARRDAGLALIGAVHMLIRT